MRAQIAALRAAMKEHDIDAYLVPTTDFHGSEYVHPYFKCREFLSGFTGSAGTLLVTHDAAKLWTDGRYFLQAEAQLAGSGIDLMKEREPGVPTLEEYMESTLSEGSCLGFDGRILNHSQTGGFAAKYRLRTDLDLAGDVWAERPHLHASKIYSISEDVAGESAGSKLERVRRAMLEAGADCHLVTSLESIAWIYNLRGDDVKNTPVFFAFAVIEEKRDRLYLLDDTFAGSAAAAELPETTEILPYFNVFEDMKHLKAECILLNPDKVSHELVKCLPADCRTAAGAEPAEQMKAVKNAQELKHTEEAHRKDGAAMVSFIRRIKEAVVSGAEVTELDAATWADECRSRQKGFLEPSFDTIAGYAANGAIVHYAVTEETSQVLKPEGFLLVDSGGQYCDGTTDITRTIALGPLTEEMKQHYTLVLKGHITLAMAVFDETADGAQLDQLARRPLLDAGLNYNHGTGHGVGHLLSVHEGPNSISPRADGRPILPGMITTDEPGVYLEGKYGIRLENELLCVEQSGKRRFRPLTWCPWEREAIVKELLSPEEIKWVDDYHKDVFAVLDPYLDEETAAWLKEAVRPL